MSSQDNESHGLALLDFDFFVVPLSVLLIFELAFIRYVFCRIFFVIDAET